MTNKTFADLGVAEPLLRALSADNYTHPTPIQAQTIPPLLSGRDLMGIAQTGTGKTAAFALPILQQLEPGSAERQRRGTRALILAPTRELAIQICDSFTSYGRHLSLRRTVIFGGVGQNPQVRVMSGGVDILVATPGRLLDLMQQGHVRLDGVTHLVLDEADRMLDMGFIRDIRKIMAKVPKDRQTMLFSATMPAEITRLAGDILRNPLRVEVTPEVMTVDLIDQFVYFVDGPRKRDLLAHLMQKPELERVIIFTRTKHGANKVALQLEKAGIASDAIHGNKSQNARQRALEDFRAGKIRALVATDIAARGIDVDGVTHVINYELPNIAESYVHRIGRTARAGAAGVAIAFCDGEERAYLRDIERLTRQPLTVVKAENVPTTARPVNDEPVRGANHNKGPRKDGAAQQNRPPRRRRRNNGGNSPVRRAAA